MNTQFSKFASILALSTVLSAASAQTVPEIKFDATTDFLKLPEGTWMGEVAGVATNSKGDIYVYTRTGNPTLTLGLSRSVSHGGSRLFMFDKNGKFTREIGQGAYGFLQAQMLRVDAQDNIWLVDSSSQLVMKFDPNGRVQQLWGRKPEVVRVPTPALSPLPYGVPVNQAAAENEERGAATPAAIAARRGATPQSGGVPGERFDRPSDVVWDAQGNVYVADGIGGARVAKYAETGRWIKGFGTRGNGPGQFNVIHGIAIDAQQNLYVADEGNKRIQVFDTEGNFKREIVGIGTPTAICITPGPRQVMYVAHTGDADGMEDAAIYKVELNGTVIGKFGKAGKLVKEFNLVNSIDCRRENELLVGELGSWRVQKVTLKP